MKENRTLPKYRQYPEVQKIVELPPEFYRSVLMMGSCVRPEYCSQRKNSGILQKPGVFYSKLMKTGAD